FCGAIAPLPTVLVGRMALVFGNADSGAGIGSGGSASNGGSLYLRSAHRIVRWIGVEHSAGVEKGERNDASRGGGLKLLRDTRGPCGIDALADWSLAEQRTIISPGSQRDA